MSSSGGGRSKAAAYAKLKAALQTHPSWIVQSIEQQMDEDFNSFRSQPGGECSSHHVSCVGGAPVEDRPLSFDDTSRMAPCWSARLLLLGVGCNRPSVDGFRKLDAGAGIPVRSLHPTGCLSIGGQWKQESSKLPGWSTSAS